MRAFSNLLCRNDSELTSLLSLSLSLALALALSLFAPKLLSQKKLSTLYRLWKEFWADLDNGKGEIRKSSPSSYCADYAPSALSIQNKSEILFKGKRWKGNSGTTAQWSAYGLRFDHLPTTSFFIRIGIMGCILAWFYIKILWKYRTVSFVLVIVPRKWEAILLDAVS